MTFMDVLPFVIPTPLSLVEIKLLTLCLYYMMGNPIEPGTMQKSKKSIEAELHVNRIRNDQLQKRLTNIKKYAVIETNKGPTQVIKDAYMTKDKHGSWIVTTTLTPEFMEAQRDPTLVLHDPINAVMNSCG